MAESNENNTVSDDQEQLATYDEANSESDIGFYQELFAQFKKGIHFAIPAVVERLAYSNDMTNTKGYCLYVAVRPLVQRVVNTSEGVKHVDRPLYIVPVVGFGSGGTTLCSYPKEGTVGLLLACDRNFKTAIEENSAFAEDIEVDLALEMNLDMAILNEKSNIFLDRLDKVTISNNKGPQPPDNYSIGSFHNGIFIPFNFGCIGEIKKNKDGRFLTGYPQGCAIEGYRIISEGTENEEKLRSSILNVTSEGVRAIGDRISARGKHIRFGAPGGIDRDEVESDKNEYNGASAYISIDSYRDRYTTGNRKTSLVDIYAYGVEASNPKEYSEGSPNGVYISSTNGKIILDSQIENTWAKPSETNTRTPGIQLESLTEVRELKTDRIFGNVDFYVGDYPKHSDPYASTDRGILKADTMSIVTDIRKEGNTLYVHKWTGKVFAQKSGDTETITISL